MKGLVVSEHGAFLTVKNGVFQVRKKGQKLVEVSPAEVDEIVVTASVTVSTQAIRQALRHGISLFFLDVRGSPWGVLMPSIATETVKTRKAQYEVVISQDERYGKEMIFAKVYNQAMHLKYWARLGYRTSHKEVLGKDEPTAARLYWQDLANILPRDLGFEGRDPDSQDQFNLALNYSYAILYSKAFKYLFLSGLDPYLGFVHKDRPGSEALVYDFSEMFKPWIDFVLVRAFREGFRIKAKGGLIDTESRASLAKIVLRGLEEKVKEVGDHNPKTVEQAIRAHALRLASAIRDKADYRGFRLVL